jgi:hypothetical protein
LDRFVENSNLLAQLPPGNEHRPDKPDAKGFGL